MRALYWGGGKRAAQPPERRSRGHPRTPAIRPCPPCRRTAATWMPRTGPGWGTKRSRCGKGAAGKGWLQPQCGGVLCAPSSGAGGPVGEPCGLRPPSAASPVPCARACCSLARRPLQSSKPTVHAATLCLRRCKACLSLPGSSACCLRSSPPRQRRAGCPAAAPLRCWTAAGRLAVSSWASLRVSCCQCSAVGWTACPRARCHSFTAHQPQHLWQHRQRQLCYSRRLLCWQWCQ